MRASELNIVTYPGYTDADARRASVAEGAATYLEKNFDEKDALFLVEITDAEGEFALGLVRRTFDETPQQLADGE
eukprot:2277738-Pleurochrysis_carterae.AAC.1